MYSDVLRVLALVLVLSEVLENLLPIGFNLIFDVEFLLEVLGVGFVACEVCVYLYVQTCTCVYLNV